MNSFVPASSDGGYGGVAMRRSQCGTIEITLTLTSAPFPVSTLHTFIQVKIFRLRCFVALSIFLSMMHIIIFSRHLYSCRSLAACVEQHTGCNAVHCMLHTHNNHHHRSHHQRQNTQHINHTENVPIPAIFAFLSRSLSWSVIFFFSAYLVSRFELSRILLNPPHRALSLPTAGSSASTSA